MGSSSSKSAETSSSAGVRRNRSGGTWVFQSSCLGPPPGSYDSDNDGQVPTHQLKENGRSHPFRNQTDRELDRVKPDCYRKAKVDQSAEIPGIELDEWGQSRASVTDTLPGRGGSSSSQASSTRFCNPSNRFLSRFTFFPGNVSFRLGRSNSLRSSRSQPISSTGIAMPNSEEQETFGARNATADVSFDQVTSMQQAAGDNHNDNSRTGFDLTSYLHSPRNENEQEGIDSRPIDRRIGIREPVESNFRFSRTLSVGRLRDRVLRRSSFSDEARGLTSEGNNTATSPSSIYSLSTLSGSLPRNQEYDGLVNSRSREARYHDLLEHRSNFLERRRRIRSQVRALQRLGSRFENLSGHERSCILSGQHLTGRCTCCLISSQSSNSSDDTTARASISRIVMLAEALFEVLDEIHQQSVVLSSRPSVSSIGSVPAPNEVVESLPLKLFAKRQKHQNDEAAQCYICLVEYDEGDCMRILPCHHEFHSTCIDKWLTEIHRVCPLCRGDICRSDSCHVEDAVSL